MYKIEKNIPVPKKKKEKSYPFGDMVVGDSFVVSGNEILSLRQAASHYAKFHTKKFITRRIKGDEYRIWRIS